MLPREGGGWVGGACGFLSREGSGWVSGACCFFVLPRPHVSVCPAVVGTVVGAVVGACFRALLLLREISLLLVVLIDLQ